MFTIKQVARISQELVSVTVAMPVKEWTKYRNAGHLGHLYATDISNAVYRGYGVQALSPIVSDRNKAKGGIKVIELTYHDLDWIDAPVNNVIHVDFVARRRAA